MEGFTLECGEGPVALRGRGWHVCVGSHVNEGRLDTNMCKYVDAHRHRYRFTCVHMHECVCAYLCTCARI